MADQNEDQKISRKIDFFNFDLKNDENKKTVFKDIYKKNNGNWSAIKSELAEKKVFDNTIINKLEFTQHLSDWSKDNKELISLFQKDSETNSLRDIAAKLNKDSFINKVKGVVSGKSEEQKKNSALNLHRELFHLEPTAMLVNMIKDSQVPLLNDAIGGHIAAVLEKQPDFNIKTTSIYEVIKNEAALKDIPTESREPVITRLKTLQRLTAVSPVPDAVPILYNANIQSSMQISAIPPKQFMAVMKKSGLDDAILAQIHAHAQQSRLRNEQAIMALREAGMGAGINMIDKSMNVTSDVKVTVKSMNAGGRGAAAPATFEETLAKHNLSWDLLFGDADFCECEENHSVYSPAAYYVDLLQYLRNNNLDPNPENPIPIKANPKDISGTPLAKLFKRRPDLGCVELTGKNTVTVMPYIDQVNEVMESYVAFQQPKPFNVEDETSSELLAEPQNTEYLTYCKLKNTVYPFTLPYHQPIDAIRIYLKHLDTSRYELIKTFRKDNSSNDAKLARWKDDALDRAADAEFLGLTMEEYVILTKECFETRELMGRIKNRSLTNDEYQQLIGVQPVYKYYGFDDDKIMLGDDGLTLIKKEFLRRTGIDYVNLVDLLKTRFINPCLPTGKSKTIMESLHFSYRFLQSYAKTHGMDNMAEGLVIVEKIADLAPMLHEEIAILTNKKTLSCPKSTRDEIDISDKDIIHWVKCHFKKVGQMIVIESGRGCVNGQITGIDYFIVVEDCKIFMTSKKIEIGRIDKKDGKVSFKDNDSASKFKDALQKNRLHFTGEKGEKGVFLVIDNEPYLVFLEQRDSCDPDTAFLRHLDGTPLTADEYDRIHRFIRLWRKLGWTIDETDQAISALGVIKPLEAEAGISICEHCGDDECNEWDCSDDCDDADTADQELDITPELIRQLAAVKKLLNKTGLELVKLLCFWSNIITSGEKPLYKRLFLTHNILGIDKVFKADEKGNYLTSDAQLLDHAPAVMAALNLSADDIQAITKFAGMENKLTLGNLSKLYRYRLLSKVLGLRIPAFLSILPLFGDIFQDAHETLVFLKRWAKMEDAGFTHQQLNFIINGVDAENKPFAPTEKVVLQLSKTLYDGLNTIDETHQDLKADPSITKPEEQEKNIQDQAITELVRTKASLLFETSAVDKLIGLLEGTNIFTTKLPEEFIFPSPDANTIKNKLRYDNNSKSIQITGILTDQEIADYKAISNKTDWEKALDRIQKQQAKLYKELLSEVFEKEEAAAETIKAGDVIIPIPENKPDPNTAPVKRAAFLKIFLPYLRQQLAHRYIIDTLANYSELDTKVTDTLVSKVLKLGGAVEPIYDIFEKIKASAKPDKNNWEGYLIPAIDSAYTFIIKKSSTKPVISLDGNILDFTAQEEPLDELWSILTPLLHLQAGKLYKLTATGIKLENIFWKTPASAITSIPSSALIPDFASKNCQPALTALKKAAMLVSVFNLSADEIRFFNNNAQNFEGLDFNKLTLAYWLRLEAYVRLRNSLSQAKLDMLGFWNWIYAVDSAEVELVTKIVELTTWKKERIEKIIAADHFNISKLADYRDEKNLLKIQKALSVADKIGIDIDLLFDWAIPVSDFKVCRKIADSIKNAIRAKYNQTDYEQVVRPLHDQLRNNQKEALIAYLLQQKELIAWNVTDADGLFEYFLIDVQMDACMETSRIKQAISSVQLFIQRCFLGLESEKDEHGNEKGVANNVLDRDRWYWMQRYRVWEANRKVFLYPENWIESNLRDDKSQFFKELESELLQKDINKQNVTDALKAYLYKVDEVANMEVVGLYIEGKKETKKTPDGEKVEWPNGAKLHVFSRTRNAPYFFYYRYLALDEMNWYPWEKIQVDIPTYDFEHEVTYKVDSGNEKRNELANGCYLTPLVWNRRLLIFFPEFMKKTEKSSASSSGDFNTLGNSGTGITDSQPSEYWEIRIAWSEYRNGKWTQKQLCKDSGRIPILFPIENFKFIPSTNETNIIIGVEDKIDNDQYVYKFRFEGNNISYDGLSKLEGLKLDDKVDSSLPNQYLPHFFHKSESDNLTLKPMLIKNNVWMDSEISSTDNAVTNQIFINYPNFNLPFYNPNTGILLGLVNLERLEKLFQYNIKITLVDDAFGNDVDNIGNKIYNELKRPYSLYNWELFFHTPLLLADALSKAQHFEEAMKWYHFVFNPIADGNSLTKDKIDKRFWQFRPFQEIESQRILDHIFNNLKPNTEDKTINEWRNNPFMPHLVARSRPVAYMKWVVMKYIDNLLAWGDNLFRQDTIETINQATQLYILAGHILGPKPMMIPKRGKIKPQTYLGLLDKWDASSNAMEELELAAPYSNQTFLPYFILQDKELAFANIYGTASSLYFCIPNNPKLMGYWDTLADRLYKIRHSLNIEGVFRKLPLFEPPIDPALLVKAAAQGLSIASVLNDLNTPMPNYRFYYLLQKSLELCNELKSLGGAMLSAIEKKDNETISLIRAKHEGVMQNLVMEIKKKQLEEAQKNLESLQQNRKSPEARMKYYLKLSGLEDSLLPGETADFSEISNEIVTVDGDSGLKLIPFEKEDMDKASEAQDWQRGIGIVETLGGILNLIPNFEAKGSPFGVGAGVAWGGSFLGAAAHAVARGLQVHASDLSFSSSNAGKKGGFTRALQERIFQANAAGYELKQIDKQITAQEIRIDIANREIANQQKAIDNANEVEEFIKNKYSNEELYTWMRGNLKTLYHQVYSLAYEHAKKAEKTYCFERGINNANFIQTGYFDAGRDGLLAGEQLYVGLKQLEAAYQNERGHDYEITKQISLYQVNPLAIIQMRETGRCEFALPEVFFDMDYSGHYKRRIKSLALSFPCIVGPHTGINATLRLLENKFRNTSIGGKSYEEDTESTDERFTSHNIPISAIAASSAQNESGMFELNFKDERYLPFEGAGVISKWRLELPTFRQFDYHSIADVIINLKYTACEGGERLKSEATRSVWNWIKTVEEDLIQTGFQIALDFKHDLPNEWHLFKQNEPVYLKIDNSNLPYIVQPYKDKASIINVMFVAKVKENLVNFSLKVDKNTINLTRIDEWKLFQWSSSNFQLGKSFELSIDSELTDKLEELIIVVKYSFKQK